jgi:crotonobetainyl-CoA:carnitine CoA-transferase CaiB-like acyl-CoA transferase
VLELVQRLSAAGVPCGPIYDIGEAFEDPHIKSLGMTISAAHPKEGDLALLRSPINLSRFPPEKSFDRPAPDAGADTDEVLTELGLDGKEIGDLRTRGVIE